MPILQNNKANKICRSWALTATHAFGKTALGLFLFIAVLGGGAYFLLKSALPAHFIREQLNLELQKQYGQNAQISVGKIQMDSNTSSVTAQIHDISVKSPSGQSLLNAPRTEIDFGSSNLAQLDFNPKRIVLKDTHIGLTITPDGQILIAQNTNQPPQSLSQIMNAAKNLPELTLENGSIEINDQRGDHHYIFSNIQVTLANAHMLDVNLQGQSGLISAKLTQQDDPLSFKLSAQNITIADLNALSGANFKLLNKELPLSIEANFGLSDNAHIKQLEGTLTTGEGQIIIDDPEAKPIQIVDAALSFAYQPDTQKLIIPNFSFNAGGVAMQFLGEVTPNLELNLNLKNGVLAPLTAQDKPIPVNLANINVIIDKEKHTVTLTSLDLRAENLNALIAGQMQFDEQGRMGLSGNLTITQSDARSVLHVWPAFIASNLRHYLIQNVSEGLVTQAHLATTISVQTFADIKIRKPMPADSISSDVAIQDMQVTLIPGVPPLSNLNMKGHITGRQASFSGVKSIIKLQSGKVLSLNEGTFGMPDLAQHPIEAKSQFKLNGPLEGVMELLSYPALKGVLPAYEKASVPKGIFDGVVNISLPLKDKLQPSEVNLQAKATLQSFVVENFLGKDSFEAQAMQFTAQTGVVSLKGEGKVGTIPARIDLVQPRANNNEDGAITFSLDEAAQIKRGINLSPQLKGTVSVLVKSDFPVNIKAGLPIEIDLTKTTIDGLLPTWVKPAGKLAKLRFTLSEREGGYRATNIETEGAAPKIKGNADLDASGNITSFQLTSLVLSAGDTMQVEGQKTANGLKLKINANSFDARPFLRGSPKNTSSTSRELDIEIKAVALSGFNNEIAANADIHLVKSGLQIKQGSFTAKLNGVPVTAKISPRSAGSSNIAMNTQNAGAVLRFMDIYNRMQGGALNLHLMQTGGVETGDVTVNEFSLHDEPAFKRAAAAASSDVSPKRDFVSDANAVEFTKLRLNFTRKGDYFDVSDAVMWGREVGGTLSGQLDYSKDFVNITGTFVPAYGLNNAFSKIPVVGLLLTGNKYEGVFSVPFQVTGRASKPSLTINPIAAVSPGFLRKIFDFKGGGTGSLPVGDE